MFIQTSKGWTPSFFPEGHIGVLLNDSLVLGAQLFKRGIIRPVFSREKFEDVSRENINRRTTTMSVEPFDSKPTRIHFQSQLGNPKTIQLERILSNWEEISDSIKRGRPPPPPSPYDHDRETRTHRHEGYSRPRARLHGLGLHACGASPERGESPFLLSPLPPLLCLNVALSCPLSPHHVCLCESIYRCVRAM